VTILSFWAFLFAAMVGLAAYQQADEPGWKFPLGAFVIAAVGCAYLYFGFPEELFNGQVPSRRHPDFPKFRAVIWVVVVAVICLVGALVGEVLRGMAKPALIGFRTSLVGFFCMIAVLLSGVFA
jgi:hypothetical protein